MHTYWVKERSMHIFRALINYVFYNLIDTCGSNLDESQGVVTLNNEKATVDIKWTRRAETFLSLGHRGLLPGNRSPCTARPSDSSIIPSLFGIATFTEPSWKKGLGEKESLY
jgi:hypothetical protein